ncbi:MAG: hypothetical protein ABSG26_03980 [Bryobacteraceae bacterium]|jgi:hypothetical protein
MKRALVSVVAVLLCLVLAACTQSQIINSIDVALTAASIALPIVASAVGLPPAVVAEIVTWIQSALKGLSAVSDDLLTGGPAGTVAAKITADLSGVVAATPNLQGLPVAIASVVQALATDVQDILTTYGASTLSTTASRLSPSPLGGKEIHFGTHDRQRLIALRAKALGLLADSDVRLQMLKK